MNIYLYGPPGSGKSTLGRHLAQALDLPFCDLDEQIERNAGETIVAIFSKHGEEAFRELELTALQAAAAGSAQVVALGGGALLNPQARSIANSSGTILLLETELPVLLERISKKQTRLQTRPLLAGDPVEKMNRLMKDRASHYDSFPLRLGTSRGDVSALVWEAQRSTGAFRIRAMGNPYDVRVRSGGLATLGEALRERRLLGPVVVVTDTNVAAYYLELVVESLRGAGYAASSSCIPSGEMYKTIETVQHVWNRLLEAKVERGSTIVALGGGVVGDLTGFAAATFLRGVAWVNVPTTLLAMVDSSLGGKTGVDLPQAKNLVGAFYPPRLVWVDPLVLQTLPDRELRGGLAEALKHGVIADPVLFDRCAAGFAEARADLERIVREAAAVKARVIEEDPYEKGPRQALNLGHTIGHGVEIASDYRLSHGEAVAIGMVAEARLAEVEGIAGAGIAATIEAAARALGLPTEIPPDLDRQRIIQAVGLDKKRSGGKIGFALPVRVGEVRTGVFLDRWEERI